MNYVNLNKNMIERDSQLKQESEKTYTNLVNKIPQESPGEEKGLLETLIRLRDDSIKKEKEYFKQREKDYSTSFLQSELNEWLKCLKAGDEEYINFFSKKDGNFFKKILLGRELSKQEDNFIDFLYSKEVIKGLSSDMIVRFEAESFQKEGFIGSGSAITIKELFDGVRNTVLNEAMASWTEAGISEECTQVYAQQLLSKIVQAFDGIELVMGTTGGVTKGRVLKRGKETVSAMTLLEREYGIFVTDEEPRKLYVVNAVEKEYFRELSDAARRAKESSSGKTKSEIDQDVARATGEKLEQKMQDYLKNKNVIISNDKKASEYFYTPFFLNSEEFKRIASKLTDVKAFIDQKAQEGVGEESVEKGFSSFSDFLTHQINNATGFEDAKKFWNNFLNDSNNADFINKLNEWGKGYSNGSNVIGHIGEHFAKYYLRNSSTIFAQSKNLLGQDAHVDIGSLGAGFQVKNYSGAVNSFHLYDSDTSIFGRTISRYINPNFTGISREEIIVSLRYISANKNVLNGNDASNIIKNFLELNFDYWTRYDDAKSNFEELQGMKNNFFILNFKLIPASLIFQQLINKIKLEEKGQYFNLDKFYMEEEDELEKIYDLSKDQQDLNRPHFGRVIFKGFKFNIANLNNTKYEN